MFILNRLQHPVSNVRADPIPSTRPAQVGSGTVGQTPMPIRSSSTPTPSSAPFTPRMGSVLCGATSSSESPRTSQKMLEAVDHMSDRRARGSAAYVAERLKRCRQGMQGIYGFKELIPIYRSVLSSDVATFGNFNNHVHRPASIEGNDDIALSLGGPGTHHTTAGIEIDLTTGESSTSLARTSRISLGTRHELGAVEEVVRPDTADSAVRTFIPPNCTFVPGTPPRYGASREFHKSAMEATPNQRLIEGLRSRENAGLGYSSSDVHGTLDIPIVIVTQPKYPPRVFFRASSADRRFLMVPPFMAMAGRELKRERHRRRWAARKAALQAIAAGANPAFVNPSILPASCRPASANLFESATTVSKKRLYILSAQDPDGERASKRRKKAYVASLVEGAKENIKIMPVTLESSSYTPPAIQSAASSNEMKQAYEADKHLSFARRRISPLPRRAGPTPPSVATPRAPVVVIAAAGTSMVPNACILADTTTIVDDVCTKSLTNSPTSTYLMEAQTTVRAQATLCPKAQDTNDPACSEGNKFPCTFHAVSVDHDTEMTAASSPLPSSSTGFETESMKQADTNFTDATSSYLEVTDMDVTMADTPAVQLIPSPPAEETVTIPIEDKKARGRRSRKIALSNACAEPAAPVTRREGLRASTLAKRQVYANTGKSVDGIIGQASATKRCEGKRETVYCQRREGLRASTLKQREDRRDIGHPYMRTGGQK